MSTEVAIGFPCRFACPHRAHAAPNVTSIEKRRRRLRMPSRRLEEEEETPRLGSRKARRQMQHPIYF
jgi:hypothetical protein